MAKTATSKYSFPDMTKAFGDFRLPGFDVETVVAIQRKNLEAFAQANQLALEGARAVAQRQAEIVQQVIEQASALVRDWTQLGAPEDRVAKNVEVAKLVYEKSVTDTRELAELVTKANTEAFNVISRRFTESLDEVRDYAKKQVAA